MPSLVQSQLDVLTVEIWGARLDRAAALLPQTTNTPYFTVSGGRVIVNMLLGQVTVVLVAGTNNAKWIAVPTTGSNVDLCATVDTASLEVGGKLVVPGVAATAMTKANAGAIIAASNSIIVDPGTLNFSCDASKAGQIKWSIFWTPFDDGAFIVTA